MSVSLGKQFNDRRNLEKLRVVHDELTNAENELERFFHLVPDLFCIADASAHFVKLNFAWVQTLGWTLNELQTFTFLDFVHPDDVDATRSVMAEMTTMSLRRFSNRYRTKDGLYLPLEWSAASWTDGLTYASARIIAPSCYQCPAYPQKLLQPPNQDAKAAAGLKS